MFDSNVMVVKTTSTRKKTFDDYEDDLDVDALRRGSRRADANLINGINARLESDPVVHRRVIQHTPRATSVPPPRYTDDLDFPDYTPRSALPARGARASSVMPREYALDDYYGLEDELDSAPLRSRTRTVPRFVRARSVPITRRFSNASAKVTPSHRVRPVTLSSHSFLNDTSSSHLHRTPLHRAGSITRAGSIPRASSIPRMGSPSRGLHPRAAKYAGYDDDDLVMLDRYLPLSMAAPVPVPYEVEAKYGELAARMPTLDRNRGALARDNYTPPRASSVPRYTPYKPAPRPAAPSSTLPGTLRDGEESSKPRPKAPSYRPPVSDVRRRAREVLCKSKNDPKYFDY